MRFCVRRRRFLCLLSVLALGMPLSASAADESTDGAPNRVPALVQPSMAYLDLNWTSAIYDSSPPAGYLGSENEPVAQVGAQCSGFFVSPNGHVMTASHCTEYGSDIRDALLEQGARWAYEHGYFRGSPTLATVTRYAQRYFRVRNPELTTTVVWSYAADGSDPKHLPARQLGNRPFLKGDVALLKIGAAHTIPLPVSSDPVEIGMSVNSVGFPASVDDVTDADKVNPSFKDGEISSKKTIQSGLQDVYEVSSAISPGMSGGPTVNVDGEVIGVNSFRPREESQQFNFVSPASLVDELLKDKGVQPRESRDADLLREGITAVLDEKRNKALDALDDLVDREPEWKIAATYRAQALQLPKESTGMATWLIALIAVGGTLLLAALAVTARRRGALPGMRPASTRAGRAPTKPAPATTITPAPGGTSANDIYLLMSGPNGVERIPVDGELSIGRTDADIRVDDHEVSRRHALIRPVAGGLEVVDAGSSNGTLVNERRIDGSRSLGNGDVIRVGNTELTVEAPTAAQTDTDAPVLVVTSGSLAGERLRVTDTLTIGREDADVVLDDPEISRNHAVIRIVDGHLEIADAGSSNGTVVNGTRIHSAYTLTNGDTIKLGQTTIDVELAAPSSATVLSPGGVPPTIVDPSRRPETID
jgi:serine protease Do